MHAVIALKNSECVFIIGIKRLNSIILYSLTYTLKKKLIIYLVISKVLIAAFIYFLNSTFMWQISISAN